MSIGTNMGTLPICERLHEEGLGYGIGPALLCQEAADTIEMLVEAADQARILIGAKNDNASAIERECNVNQAWHLLNNALSKARGSTSMRGDEG